MQSMLTFSLAKLAPSKISIAGTVRPPKSVTVTRIKLSGGFASGASGSLVPVHSAVSTKSAVSGRMVEHGMPILTAIDKGISNALQNAEDPLKYRRSPYR